MTRPIRSPGLRPTMLMLALLAAFAPTQAQDSQAEGSVTLGLGLLDGDGADRARFGQYNGRRLGGQGFGLLGVDYERRNAAAGTVVQFEGRNLLGDTRELNMRWNRQGDWKFGANYYDAVRHDPNTVNTGLLGAGSTSPQVQVLAGVGAGSDLDFKVKRTGIGASFWKSLSRRVEFELSLKSEDKSGARLFGSGMTCPSPVAPGCGITTGVNTGSALLMLPEPIKANHSQVEARLLYAGDQLRLNGGYYGSFYSNRYDRLTPGVPASLNNPLGTLLPLSNGLQAILSQPLALPPDNQAHHIDLSGVYAVTPTTRLSFKLGYAQALQHQDFASAGFTQAPAGAPSLGGRVATTLARVGLSARPLPKLWLNADLRFEDKDDQTPIALYNIQGLSTYTNRSLPNRKEQGKLQAAYQFSSEVRGTLAGEVESIDRGVFTATSAVSGISALRQKTDETTLRAELRSRMTATLSGAISVQSSRRDGSNWLKPNSGLGVSEVADPSAPGSGLDPTTAIFMPTLADRERDKFRLRADWQPTESLALQFTVEDGKDRYTSASQQGLQSSGMRMGGVDWDYAWSDDWRINGHVWQGVQRVHQSRPAGAILSFKNRNTAVGLGLVAQPMDKVEIGANLSYVDDLNVYAQTLDAFAPPDSVALLAATGGLPDIVFRQTTLKLFGRYTIDKRSSVRVDLVHQRSRYTDWAWGTDGAPFTYADGSTVLQQPVQAVTLIALTYRYSWR